MSCRTPNCRSGPARVVPHDVALTVHHAHRAVGANHPVLDVVTRSSAQRRPPRPPPFWPDPADGSDRSSGPANAANRPVAHRISVGPPRKAPRDSCRSPFPTSRHVRSAGLRRACVRCHAGCARSKEPRWRRSGACQFPETGAAPLRSKRARASTGASRTGTACRPSHRSPLPSVNGPRSGRLPEPGSSGRSQDRTTPHRGPRAPPRTAAATSRSTGSSACKAKAPGN